jgi:apolipoprotein N-acyltransferase
MSPIRILPEAITSKIAPGVHKARSFSVVYYPAGTANRAKAVAWGILIGSCAMAGSLVWILPEVRDVFRLASAAGLLLIGVIAFVLACYYCVLTRSGKREVSAPSQPPDTFQRRKD